MAKANTNTPAAKADAGQAGQYLTFGLGTETFAIGIMAIKEIIEYASLTEVPMMPTYVRGVINLRGSVVPVLDLPARFGKASSEVTTRTCIVIEKVLIQKFPLTVGTGAGDENWRRRPRGGVLQLRSVEQRPVQNLRARSRRSCR